LFVSSESGSLAALQLSVFAGMFLCDHDRYVLFCEAKGRRQIHSRLGSRNLSMPAKSKKQQMAAGAALAAKRGQRSKSSLRGASRSMAKSMSKAELRRMAKTKRKGKPTRSGKKKR
jgi:hypothetical protein